MRQYLLLIRLPNVFTAPPDIAAGYFAAVAPSGEIDIVRLAALMISSGLLYIAGIIFNDYFDMEIDRKERPFRPLPSGNVSKRLAVVIALSAFAAANMIAFKIGLASFAISIALSLIIIAYDYWLKHTVAGPFAMGGARSLNVLLGASAGIFSSSTYLSSSVASSVIDIAPRLGIAVFAAASLFAYVVAITLLSKKEMGSEKPSSLPFSIVFAIIATIAVIGLVLMNLLWVFLLNLLIFAGIMIITFKKYVIAVASTDTTNQPSVQKAIRNMVISIVVLDSVFVSGTAGLAQGLATLLFIVPAVLLAKKLYVT